MLLEALLCPAVVVIIFILIARPLSCDIKSHMLRYSLALHSYQLLFGRID